MAKTKAAVATRCVGVRTGRSRGIRSTGRRGGALLPGVAFLGLAGAAWWGVAAAESAAREPSVEVGAPQDPQEPQGDDAALTAAFAAAGVLVDPAGGALAFPVSVEVRGEALEYLLVNPHGAVHESLFVTEVDAEVLATAFLAVGAEPGKNVEYIERVPAPTREEVRAGARTHDVVVPSGKPVYLYAVWREAAGAPDAESGLFAEESTYLHRMEDLVLDLQRDRTLRRHGWVWLGSRIVEADGQPPRFAAQATGNLAAVTFFSDGDTLFTAAVPECTSQTNWYPNGWLLPRPGAGVLLIASMSPIDRVPDAFAKAVPFVAEPDPDAEPQRRR